VSLFFAISGFLITTLLLRERDRNGTINLKKFYARRSLRIFPLYYTVLLAYIALVFVMERNTGPGQAFLGNLPYFLTYTSNWFVPLTGGRVIFYFAWTLATEEQFYLIWPGVERYLGVRKSLIAMLVVIAVACAASSGALPLESGSLTHTIITSIALPICMGVVLAHTLHSKLGFSAAYRILGHKLASPVLLVAVIAGVCIMQTPFFLVYTLMVALVGACTIREDHGIAILMKWRPMVRIGVVSYGMYLLHMLTHNVVGKLLANHLGRHGSIVFLIVTVATYGVAWISFRYYESFFLRLKTRFAS